ncbi:PLP-dependent cysteine synthase family protein [Aliarcobacter butzleri]|uniref:PLP-dependent cysteine synthase family protein n=1 Tax=Aliarcobacter butzleri TaxID=28197 RepID=UPI0021B3D13D|nr:cysteine synthase family protein [Aliarcobacter butzleri]MCT7586793.1 cysteine synthase family protein [Aliarcobacter butzleri]
MANKTILDLVGNTPLIKLNQITKVLNDVSIYAKCEYLNPSGSVKDRAAKAIILEAINSNKLTKDKILLDSTSGNTGIAYAMFGANLGYKVSVTLPKNANFERKRILKAFGATIIETDPLLSSDGSLIKAKELAEENPDIYYYTNQYNNENNWKAHYNSTALEIWEQSEKKVTHFIAGMGTSGTFVGTSRRLKELNPNIKTVAMQPSSPFHGLEGMKHMATTIVPEIYDSSLIDETIEIDTEDARRTTLELIRKEGLFVGISSGANVYAALQLAKTLPKGSVVVTILCDSGFKYLSDSLWEEDL